MLRADGAKYSGPFWVMLHAGGGWDTTCLCDPKGGVKDDKASVNQSYAADAIGTAGPFKYAPVSWVTGNDTKVEVFSVKRFFDAHHQRLTVVNGIDNTTNNHDTGTRMTWSGKTTEGQPALAALAAGVAAGQAPLPMAFLSNGGYDATAGVVPLTRSGSLDALRRLAYPNRIDPNKVDSPLFVSNDTAARIAKAQSERLAAEQAAARLSSLQGSMGALMLARQSNDGLGALAAQLDGFKLSKLDEGAEFLDDLKPVAGALGDLNNLVQQVQLAMLAFQSGVAAAVNLSVGGFDTHGDNDNRQAQQMIKLLRTLDYLYKMSDKLGFSDKLYVVVGSDFGRTPFYNKDNGKDHWNISSMMFSGPGIPGDRLVGETDAKLSAVPLDPSTLQPSPGGLKIQPNHVHRALRKKAGLEGAAALAPFGLPGEDLPLFG